MRRKRERNGTSCEKTHHLRLDADDGCLVEIQQVLFPARNDVFFPTWQAVKCASLWCVDAVDRIRAHRSRQPLIRWMTSHKRDKPIQVTWIVCFRVTLFVLFFLLSPLFDQFIINKLQTTCSKKKQVQVRQQYIYVWGFLSFCTLMLKQKKKFEQWENKMILQEK